MTESVFINGGNGNAEDTGQRASHSPSSMDKLGIVEVVAAALRTRATTSGTRRSPRTRWPCEASKVPTFFDGAYMVYFVEEAPAAEEERRWGWTSTCSVLSAIVASQVHVLKRAAWWGLGLFCFNALDALGRIDASGIYWLVSMGFLCYIVYELLVGICHSP